MFIGKRCNPGRHAGRVVRPATNQVFYLLSAEQFHSISSAGTIDPCEAYPNVEWLMAEDDANDPLLDSYQ
jgi:hypothetical protein